MLMNVDDVIDALGGTGAVAKLTGVGAPAVSNWRASQKIPATKFLVVARALSEMRTSADPALFGFDQNAADTSDPPFHLPR